MKFRIPSIGLALALGLGIGLRPGLAVHRPDGLPQAAAMNVSPLVRDHRAAAFFFYWYDITTGAHTTNPDGSDSLTDHPADIYQDIFSYKNPLWFRQELLDMRAAGIDIVLPVFWGSDAEAHWAVPGLQNLVAVEETLLVQGYDPPRIGMFFDTSSLPQQNGGRFPDLTTSSGRLLFYAMIAKFYGIVPRELRAEVGGRPLVYLYSAYFAQHYDQVLFDFIAQSFEQEFGSRPFIVRESSWRGVATDGEYAWGTAITGPRIFGPSAGLGPGFNNSAVSPPAARQVRDRECGEFYTDGWEAIIDSGAKQVAVETWNEFHEATDICFSREYGRRFIDMTRENIRRWSEAGPPPSDAGWLVLGRSPNLHGLHPAANGGDGAWRTTFLAGREAASPDSDAASPSHFIYLDVRDDFIFARTTEVWVTVEYLDSGSAEWWVEYDGTPGHYTQTPKVKPQNTGLWKNRTFHIPDAFFGGRESYNADLRLASNAGPAEMKNYFSRVWVSLVPLPGQPPNLTGWADLSLPAGITLGIPVSASNPEGHPLQLTLDRGPSFCRLVDNGNGTGTLLFSPTAVDIRDCPYRVRVLASDPSQPALTDAQTLFLTIAPETGGPDSDPGP